MPEALEAPQSAAPEETTGPVVVFDKVCIQFDRNPVLKDISFSVERGQTLIILDFLVSRLMIAIFGS